MTSFIEFKLQCPHCGNIRQWYTTAIQPTFTCPSCDEEYKPPPDYTLLCTKKINKEENQWIERRIKILIENAGVFTKEKLIELCAKDSISDQSPLVNIDAHLDRLLNDDIIEVECNLTSSRDEEVYFPGENWEKIQ